MRNLGPIIERVNVTKIFVDGADVCAIYDFVTNQPSISATPCAEWYRVEEGKIKSMSLFFDARPYEALFKSGATSESPEYTLDEALHSPKVLQLKPYFWQLLEDLQS